MNLEWSLSSQRPFGNLIRRARFAPPDRLAEVVDGILRQVGARDVVLALVDYEQTHLHPLLGGEARESAVVRESLMGTMAGRCFRDQELLAAERPGGWRVWVPIAERSDHIGVLSLTLDDVNDDVRLFCTELGLQVGQLVAAAGAYTDAYHLVRRRRNMDVAAEMQWDLLPPLSFASDQVAVAGLIEPAYDVGGDVFDYALNGQKLDFLVLDAVGHNLHSAMLSALAVGAYRHRRRSLEGLPKTAAAMASAIKAELGEEAFATAVLGSLNVRTGDLDWICAGHPPPLLLRDNRYLGELPARPDLPLGWADEDWAVHRANLEPGDLLVLYTDGVVDARRANGEPFGKQRLQHLLEREDGSDRALLDLVRRVITQVAEYRGAELEDDASLMMIQRPRPGGGVRHRKQ